MHSSVLDAEEGEVLSGAELLDYLTRTNTQQLADARRKLRAYDDLRGVLSRLTERCRIPVMAPLAGGLAYFSATMDYTNNILVLLGDNWFAERSARQAADIAARRVEFLRREETALLAEEKMLSARRDLFLAELPNAAEAMEAARRNKDAPAVSPLQETDLAVLDAEDVLTEEELMEIEEELGDRIEDDELVERVMTERLIAKKEQRVRAEMARREAERKGNAATASAAVAPCNPSPPVFHTPGDIGRVSETRAKATPSTTKKRVMFSDEVQFVESESKPRTTGVGIVLRDVMEHHTDTPAPTPAITTMAPKKKSLFMRELESNGGGS